MSPAALAAVEKGIPMTLTSESPARLQTSHPLPRTRRDRRREHRSLVRRDEQSARLAELESIREVLGRAAVVIDRGWVQDAWFSYRGAGGDVRVSYVPDRRRTEGRPALATCLVAAVHDSGAPEGAGAQVVRRALELTWHTLRAGRSDPVRWCPAPDVRAGHIRDLTRWNDRPGRTSGEVVALLEAATVRVEAERRRVLAG
jgi:hypothetical protein